MARLGNWRGQNRRADAPVGLGDTGRVGSESDEDVAVDVEREPTSADPADVANEESEVRSAEQPEVAVPPQSPDALPPEPEPSGDLAGSPSPLLAAHLEGGPALILGTNTPTAGSDQQGDSADEQQPLEAHPANARREPPTIGRVLPDPNPRLGPGVAFRRPAVSLDGVFAGDFHAGAASFVGRSHLASGTPCQDAYDFVLTEAGVLVVAIADGMGSKPNSQIGARAFCEGVVRAAVEDEHSDAAALLGLGAAAVVEAATHLGIEPSEVAFVAAVAVFTAERVRVARVGDVSAFQMVDGHFRELYQDDVDGYVNVVDASLPAEPRPEPEVTELTDAMQVVLCTDGLASDIRTSPQVREWLTECWAQPPDPSTMAEALRYRRQGSQDDRTAVVVKRLAAVNNVPGCGS